MGDLPREICEPKAQWKEPDPAHSTPFGRASNGAPSSGGCVRRRFSPSSEPQRDLSRCATSQLLRPNELAAHVALVDLLCCLFGLHMRPQNASLRLLFDTVPHPYKNRFTHLFISQNAKKPKAGW